MFWNMDCKAKKVLSAANVQKDIDLKTNQNTKIS